MFGASLADGGGRGGFRACAAPAQQQAPPPAVVGPVMVGHEPRASRLDQRVQPTIAIEHARRHAPAVSSRLAHCAAGRISAIWLYPENIKCYD